MEELVSYLLSREFRAYILEHDLFSPLLFLVRVVGITAIEIWRPARPVAYRKVFPYDLTVFLVYQFVVFPAASQINHWIYLRPHLPDTILALPLVLRVVCYLVIADCGHYWIHRLMHHQALWRIHKWHHAPTYMYWMGWCAGHHSAAGPCQPPLYLCLLLLGSGSLVDESGHRG
ncbi:MAG: hypothetical protein RL768_806, partial [Nitrospirota bacterium]